ncbi:MAG: PLP-dependent transferase [Planctomycetes bacterium]|nr:PLP-dependent transferase [Planctomycetota bacterium]
MATQLIETELQLASLVIHGGQKPDPTTGAVIPPISLASTYVQESPGVHQGFEYSRSHNPTRYAFERCIARLEGSTLSESEDVTFGGFAFASGLASTSTTLELLDCCDEIIAMDDLYGGTYRLLTNVRKRTQGLSVKYVNMTDLDALSSAITTGKTKMIWVESPTNPLMKIVDLAGVCELAKKHDILTVCDNTFATPILQRPLEFGFDIVMHSATKYLGGHSDGVGGVLVTGDLGLAERLRFLQNAIGSVLGPFDSYMFLRGIKTLAVRMKQHCENAERIATWLDDHPKIQSIIYPGLASHPQHSISQQQMKLGKSPTGGGMVTAFIKGGIDESRRFLESLSLFTLAESLGGVESLIEHPAIMTHASVPLQQREALGISDNLVRISVGIEDCDDLIADLDRALDTV